jgi:hypothetical protein
VPDGTVKNEIFRITVRNCLSTVVDQYVLIRPLVAAVWILDASRTSLTSILPVVYVLAVRSDALNFCDGTQSTCQPFCVH